MSAIRHGFGRQHLIGGIVALLVGGVFSGLSVYRLLFETGRIYPVVLIAAPFLFVIGVMEIGKSVRTPICNRCQYELRRTIVNVKMDSPLQPGATLTEQQMQSVQVLKKPSPPFTRFSYAFCPVCVSIGTVQVTTITSTGAHTALPTQEIQGSIVRTLKDRLLV